MLAPDTPQHSFIVFYECKMFIHCVFALISPSYLSSPPLFCFPALSSLSPILAPTVVLVFLPCSPSYLCSSPFPKLSLFRIMVEAA
jgi:hypothetical protein